MRKALFNLHLYLALVVGIFVLIIGLTGSIIAFEPELDRFLNPSLFRVQPQGQMLSTTALFNAARSAYAGQRIGTIQMPQSAEDSARFSVKGPKQVFLNPYTGAVIGERDPRTWLSKVHSIHLRLMTAPTPNNKTGANIVAVVTGVLIFLVLSGVYLWWPLKRVQVKWGASARRVHFDVHNAVGIYSAVFLLLLGITGMTIHFDDTLEEYLHHVAGTHKIGKAAPSVPQKGVSPVTPDQAVAAALAALPGTQVLAVSLPANPKASYVISLHYPEDLTPGGRTWANVDAFSGKVVNQQDSRTVAMGTRTIIWNRRIHTGDLFGWPTKLLMSLSCVMLIVQAITGYFLWWKRLRARQRVTELAPEANLA